MLTCRESCELEVDEGTQELCLVRVHQTNVSVQTMHMSDGYWWKSCDRFSYVEKKQQDVVFGRVRNG